MASTSVAPAPPRFPWHAHTVEECKAEANSKNIESGLTTAEAEKRLAENGPNALAPPERPSFLVKIWEQVNSALIWILIAAGGISFAQHDVAEGSLILLVVVINVAIGVVQEGKAEQAADALSNMLAPHCVVVRDGSSQNHRC